MTRYRRRAPGGSWRAWCPHHGAVAGCQARITVRMRSATQRSGARTC